ncbi:hypothetical protein STLV2gp10 [Simian T-lymphotropic virus 2]|uniref:Uncharacterized protein n=1 Tax=Simian T-lymphotropic virus 2 TaxID=33748 RepID=O70647_9DELA|nr:hypothetical protein STLV2gp10 [Simian T-lymphotropic virus 2]CAA74907.1 hypothetical protein [Simian T-lymphotropic virus 2]
MPFFSPLSRFRTEPPLWIPSLRVWRLCSSRLVSRFRWALFHPPAPACPSRHLPGAPAHLGPHRWTRCRLSSPIPYPSAPLLPHPENLQDPQGPHSPYHSCLPQDSTRLFPIHA